MAEKPGTTIVTNSLVLRLQTIAFHCLDWRWSLWRPKNNGWRSMD